MIYVVTAFLWVSTCLYLILGGADFGAGIVELFSKKDFKERTRKIMYNSIGPIWEANHMWLIIAIVILFVGFPKMYAQVSNYLHIPLVLMLLGIIARGTSFTFRNYDVIKDEWHKLYAVIFTYSSVVTPLFLGIIAGSLVSGSIDNNATTFLDAYIYSWLSWFNVSVGIFTVIICAFLASVYSIQSVKKEEDKVKLRKRAQIYTGLIFVGGAIVFIVSIWKNIPLFDWITSEIYGFIAVGLATISILLLIKDLRKGKDSFTKVYAALIVMMILFAVSYSHFPNLVLFKDGSTLSLIRDIGAISTINMLGWALLLGSVFILPFFFYLMYSFNKKQKI
ncbi:cytochrome d ubiquinol oxidase subunit II [Algoriella xinjiangensis]|uniref:Cytochrome d ubiquinol oxidase subunit II n=1 Tax=Algoriella xinjiangensis TaxID=684065 RepID=A0A1I4ZUR0_9FLAO|nr:cytochrome d ubiquinol oxidase subunit II [Algoriella xinjiangensis]SFN53972.1 cytochrome d ubiquinol oxidase subunit II [Algoriella xinjiangensis]VDH16355.1 Cytochrome d ubiquinol oxidase subunit 2 [Algoriella xinjiangensis]